MNAREQLSGMFCALPTPFDDRDEVLYSSIEAHCADMLKRGIEGFYVCGSTAEMVLLSEEERRDILSCVLKCGGGKVVAHVGSANYREAMSLARDAGRQGAKAVSAVTPFYLKYSFEEVKAFYADLAQAASLPVIVYNVPVYSSVTYTPAQLVELMSVEGVGGIKFTSSDFFALERVRTAYPDKVIYNGYDEMLLSGLAMGADGAIGSTFNAMPERVMALRDAFARGDIDEARKLQAKANECIALMLELGLMVSIKTAITQRGIPFGACRKPYTRPTKDRIDKICKELLPLLA